MKVVSEDAKRSVFQIDLNDGTYKRLAGFAGRIAATLNSRKADDDLLDTLDDLLGAVYALTYARGEFKERPGKKEKDAVIKRANELANGQVRRS